MKASDVTISSASMRIVKLLVGHRPQTVADMIRSTGVTRTAVTEQLNELVAAGFVERTTEKLSGRGRPRHLYSATDAALVLLFASNQWMVVPAMWRAIDAAGGEKLKRKVLRQVSREVAEYYNEQVDAKTPTVRFRQMTALLQEEGNLVEIEQGDDGRLLMRKRSCAFISMFEESRSVCCIDQEVLSVVVGAPIRQTTCRHDARPAALSKSNRRTASELP